MAEGRVAPGDVWRQESVTGSVFEASGEMDPDRPGSVIPTIKGSAYITSEATLILDQQDPFLFGIPV